MDVYDEQNGERSSILTNELLEKVERFVREDRRLTMDVLHALILDLTRRLSNEANRETIGISGNQRSLSLARQRPCIHKLVSRCEIVLNATATTSKNS